MTLYVVYLPPPILTTPFDSTVTRCSRDALTVDPSDGAMSGRSPAYVPTTSSRVRSTSIVALTVVEQPVHLPASRGRVVGRALVRRVGRTDQPVIGPRHEEDDLARDTDGQAGLVRDPLARHDQVGAAARQDVERAAAERVIGLGGPDARRVDDGPGRDVEIAARSSGPRRRRLDRLPKLQSLRMPVARTRVTATATGGERGPSHGQRVARVVLDAVVVEQATTQPSCRRVGASSSVSRPSTAVDASRRHGARRARRTSSARRRRTPSSRNGIP